MGVSPLILTKLVLADMLKHRDTSGTARPFGHICNIGSVVAYLLIPYQTTYCASKAGLLGFGTSLASELERFEDVTVTDVLPGPVATDIDVSSKLSHGRTAGKKAELLQKG